MVTTTQDIINLFYKPEYMALFISVVAITVNVYISWRSRKYALAKEEYFKKQQVVERITSKLLILEKQRLKLKHFFELSFKADKDKGSLFIDANDTFNRADFEKDGEEITTFLYIYFPDLGEDWNFCLDKMSELFTLVFIISKHIEVGDSIDWKKEAEFYNKVSQELGDKPKKISDRLKKELEDFKRDNL